MIYSLDKHDARGQYNNQLHECLWLTNLQKGFVKAEADKSGDVNVFSEEFEVPNSQSDPEYIHIFEPKEDVEHEFPIDCCSSCGKLYTNF